LTCRVCVISVIAARLYRRVSSIVVRLVSTSFSHSVRGASEIARLITSPYRASKCRNIPQSLRRFASSHFNSTHVFAGRPTLTKDTSSRYQSSSATFASNRKYSVSSAGAIAS
jgi:hypothetical protein